MPGCRAQQAEGGPIAMFDIDTINANQSKELADNHEIFMPRFDEAVVREHVTVLHELATGCDGLFPLCPFGENPSATYETRREIKNPIQHFRVGQIEEMVAAIMAFERHPHVNL